MPSTARAVTLPGVGSSINGLCNGPLGGATTRSRLFTNEFGALGAAAASGQYNNTFTWCAPAGTPVIVKLIVLPCVTELRTYLFCSIVSTVLRALKMPNP